MSQEIRVVSAALMPCDCMPGPYQCNVSTESQLPVCDRNGVVYTITNEPGFPQPYQVFCWDGIWYRMMDAAKVWGLFRQDTQQTFAVTDANLPPAGDNVRTGFATFNNIYAVSDRYGIRTSGTTLTIPKAGVYTVQYIGSVDAQFITGGEYTSGLSVTRNTVVTNLPRSRSWFVNHTSYPSPFNSEMTFTEYFNIGDTLTFIGSIEDGSQTADYTGYLTGAYITVREL